MLKLKYLWKSIEVKRKKQKKINLLAWWALNQSKIADKLAQNEKNEKIAFDNKIVSFFRNSILPKNYAIKFDYLIATSKIHLQRGGFESFLKPLNSKKIKYIMRGFYLILLIIFHIYSKSQNIIFTKKNIYTLKIFDYLNKHNFIYYFCNIEILKDWTKIYCLDKQYHNTFIYYYNLFLFYNLNYFEVLFNFEDYKYDFEKVLRPDWDTPDNFPRFYKPSVKEKKPLRMSTDFFDYIKRKNRVRKVTKFTLHSERVNESWNVVEKGPDDEDLIKLKKKLQDKKKYLDRHDNLYFFYIIYECALKLYDKLLLNYFDYDFFEKIKVFKNYFQPKVKFSKDNEVKVLKSPYIYICEEDIDNIKIDGFLKKVNTFNPALHLLNRKYYRIKIPLLFFLLYTIYSIQHRRSRYNLYVRGDLFFQEYFSKIQYFIWINAVNGRISYSKYYQMYDNLRLHVFYFLSNHVEFKWFNSWFTFYYSHYSRLNHILHENNGYIKPSFNFLLSNSSMLNIINKNINFIHFHYKVYSRIQYLYELYNGYFLFMSKIVSRFDKLFVFSHFNFFHYELMTRQVYLVPYDLRYLKKTLLQRTSLINYVNILIDINYLNFYFLNDFFNFNKDYILLKTIKSLNFFNKILKIALAILDPFFFKHFYWKFFPRRVWKLPECWEYIVYALFVNTFIYQFEDDESSITTADESSDVTITTEPTHDLHFNIPKFSFLMHYLYWKIETSNTYVFNFAYSNYIMQTNIAINSIYQQRFKELSMQINLFLKKSKVSAFNRNQYFLIMDVLKGHYLELLLYNIEYNFIFFLFNIKKYIKLLYNLKINPYMQFTYSTFIYRYYIYNLWLESRYYDDWFSNKKKRVFWAYKNFDKHEGPLFYTQKNCIF